MGKKNTITETKSRCRDACYQTTLLRKFTSENVFDVSYASLCKLRPFYVVEPTELDRQTCQCKIHENLQLGLEMCATLIRGNVHTMNASNAKQTHEISTGGEVKVNSYTNSGY